MEARRDPVFGELRYEPEHGSYRAQMLVAGAQVDVELKAPKHEAPERFLESAQRAWPAVISSVDAARAYACEMLLALKNDSWLQEGENPVTPEAFVARLKLDGITLRDDGSTYWFLDGDLFWGHYIDVWRNSDGTFGGADLAG